MRNLPVRAFHASPRHQFLDPLLNNTQSALETLHTVTGTPWVLTLPLAALVIRATIILPLTITQRRVLQTQASLSPVLHGWLSIYKKEVAQQVGKAGPQAYVRALSAKQRMKQDEIYKRWGVQRWKLWIGPLSQIPIWLIMVESVRRMCGTNEGLLKLGAKSVGSVKAWLGFGGATGVDPGDAGKVIAEGAHIVPEFATEGALWFQNLLVADPNLILPFVLSSVIFLNLFGHNGRQVQRFNLDRKDWRSRLTRALGVVALAVGPLTLQVPAGMLVYWISSSVLAYLQATLFDKFMPVDVRQPQKPKWTLMDEKGLPYELKQPEKQNKRGNEV